MFPGLSVAENLNLALWGGRPRARDLLKPRLHRWTSPLLRELAGRFPLRRRRRDQRASTLSGGEKKVLSFVRGANEDHALVLLDEPAEGVQAENIERMEAVIGEQRAAGTAFVIVEQNLGVAERLADRWLVMDKGQVVAQGAGRPAREAIISHIQV